MLQMKVDELITNYHARTLEIYNKMRCNCEGIEDVMIMEKVLCSLASKFDYVVYLIEELKDIDLLSLDEF